ncbi:hypothetical protein MRX96_028278 [Rhipicephalus microplus]
MTSSGKPAHETRTLGEVSAHKQPVHTHQGPDPDPSPGWELRDYIARGQGTDAEPGLGVSRDPPRGEGHPKR